MSFPNAPWAWLRTAVAAFGLVFSAGAIVLACLDYVGESLEGCDSVGVDAGAKGCPDAGATTTTTGNGSGS